MEREFTYKPCNWKLSNRIASYLNSMDNFHPDKIFINLTPISTPVCIEKGNHTSLMGKGLYDVYVEEKHLNDVILKDTGKKWTDVFDGDYLNYILDNISKDYEDISAILLDNSFQPIAIKHMGRYKYKFCKENPVSKSLIQLSVSTVSRVNESLDIMGDNEFIVCSVSDYAFRIEKDTLEQLLFMFTPYYAKLLGNGIFQDDGEKLDSDIFKIMSFESFTFMFLSLARSYLPDKYQKSVEFNIRNPYNIIKEAKALPYFKVRPALDSRLDKKSTDKITAEALRFHNTDNINDDKVEKDNKANIILGGADDDFENVMSLASFINGDIKANIELIEELIGDTIFVIDCDIRGNTEVLFKEDIKEMFYDSASQSILLTLSSSFRSIYVEKIIKDISAYFVSNYGIYLQIVFAEDV